MEQIDVHNIQIRHQQQRGKKLQAQKKAKRTPLQVAIEAYAVTKEKEDDEDDGDTVMNGAP